MKVVKLEGLEKIDLPLPQLDKSVNIEREKVQLIANSDPYLFDNQELLLQYYQEIKNNWSPAIVKRIKEQHKLNLRQKLDRCILAVMAARSKIEFVTVPSLDSPEHELQARISQLSQQLEATNAQLVASQRRLIKTNNQLNNQIKLNIIFAADRLLPAGPPLNGIQEAPFMKLLGSPTTITELERNYDALDNKLQDEINSYRREIIEMRLHPDLSSEDEDYSNIIEEYTKKKKDTIARKDLLRSTYNIVEKNWDVLKPTIPIEKELLELFMKGEIVGGWSVETFYQ